MRTPIFDFVKGYRERKGCRFHMPGHKGKSLLGPESLDITEIAGADVLYSADGIIAESEGYASSLFGTGRTFYSAEGSTLSLKAMLYLALCGRKSDTPPSLLAGRNAHKALIYAAALLDFDINWLRGNTHACECPISVEEVRSSLSASVDLPFAVYITSPDYLGNVADIKGISRVCREFGVPLLVDNAHGAYRAFLSPSEHPIALGADMCADSAHKTLPVLTGGAYLHLSERVGLSDSAVRSAMALFASTSPSYLILQSLDLCNGYLAEGYKERLAAFIKDVRRLKERLRFEGYGIKDTEELKIVIDAPSRGYNGEALGEMLRSLGIECEMTDERYVVLMLTPENTAEELCRLEEALRGIPPRAPFTCEDASTGVPRRGMSIREAVMSPSEDIPVCEAEGRICGAPTVACPPAIPIVVSGEIIGENEVLLLKKYGHKRVRVVK